MPDDVVLEIDHNYRWTMKGPVDHNHEPYFLARDDGREMPVMDGVKRIGDLQHIDSWVDWKNKVPVRKIYLEHPSVTPRVSTEYYKSGIETFEQGVPYMSRVRADEGANGIWPLDTKGEWIKLSSLVYDIENDIKTGLITCIGFGKFEFEMKSIIDLPNEQFDFDMRLPKESTVTQALARDENEERDVLQAFVDNVENSHVIIGHNITVYDNWKLHEKLKQYTSFQTFVKNRMYAHQGFYRGRALDNIVDVYPITFDTLLAARFLFKNISEVGYGLKRLATEFGLAPPNRVYERDFGGFGNWSLDNPKCLEYNRHDIIETFNLFCKEAQAIFIQMFVSGLSFQDVVAGSNGRMADHMCLVRGHDKIINPPMMHPRLASRAMHAHFNGELKTKKEIFEYFNKHWSENTDTYGCTDECVTKLPKSDDDEDKENKKKVTARKMTEKLMKVVKYGEEMPDWVTYYPFLLDYISVGGMTDLQAPVNTPYHNVKKADVAAQYPTILKGLNITSDVIQLSRKGQRVDGWCWFRRIKYKHVLELFEVKSAKEFPYSDGEGYFIGYQNRGREGMLASALTGIIKVVGAYKKKEGWKEAYEKSLKPMRNALTHGVLLNLDGTCQQFNIAGCAIPTKGQEITDNMLKYIQNNGWTMLETDTDGSEFIKTGGDEIKEFDSYVRKVEEWWKDNLKGYPLNFDVENFDHKLYIGMKNYIHIVKDKVTLKGNTLHAMDKPPIAEKCMKRAMLEILPNVNTQSQFVSRVLSKTSPIVKDEFSHLNNKDLVIIASIKPPIEYANENSAKRAKVIEEIAHRTFEFPTKMEFYVCKERLPGLDGEKTLSEPTSYMWPVEQVEELGKTIDEEWYRSMVFAYFDAAFDFKKVSTKDGIRSITSFSEQGEASRSDDESSKPEPVIDTPPPKPKEVRKQRSLF